MTSTEEFIVQNYLESLDEDSINEAESVFEMLGLDKGVLENARDQAYYIQQLRHAKESISEVRAQQKKLQSELDDLRINYLCDLHISDIRKKVSIGLMDEYGERNLGSLDSFLRDIEYNLEEKIAEK